MFMKDDLDFAFLMQGKQVQYFFVGHVVGGSVLLVGEYDLVAASLYDEHAPVLESVAPHVPPETFHQDGVHSRIERLHVEQVGEEGPRGRHPHVTQGLVRLLLVVNEELPIEVVSLDEVLDAEPLKPDGNEPDIGSLQLWLYL